MHAARTPHARWYLLLTTRFLTTRFLTTDPLHYRLLQVHRAVYKGTPVAVKVQRAGLKELFDTDLKNLKALHPP